MICDILECKNEATHFYKIVYPATDLTYRQKCKEHYDRYPTPSPKFAIPVTEEETIAYLLDKKL